MKKLCLKHHMELLPSYFASNNMPCLKGAGGVPDLGMVKIEFSIVLNRGESQLPDAFYRIKK